jgi:hypothetical protein
MKNSTQVGIVTSIWGVWLLSPFWVVFTSSPTFEFLGKILPEDMWGLITLILGLAILISGWQKWKIIEIVLAFVITFTWGLITVTFALSNLASTGTPIYGWLSFYAADTTTQLLNQYRWSKSK